MVSQLNDAFPDCGGPAGAGKPRQEGKGTDSGRCSVLAETLKQRASRNVRFFSLTAARKGMKND